MSSRFHMLASHSQHDLRPSAATISSSDGSRHVEQQRLDVARLQPGAVGLVAQLDHRARDRDARPGSAATARPRSPSRERAKAAITASRSFGFLSCAANRLLHDDRMPGGIRAGDCVIRCSQMPYLRESRHMLANWSAVDRPPPSSSLAAAVVEAGQDLVGLLEDDLHVRRLADAAAACAAPRRRCRAARPPNPAGTPWRSRPGTRRPPGRPHPSRRAPRR